MKRLLLASYGVGALPELAGGNADGLRLAFVPTAAGPDAETKEWVQSDRRQLEVLGCEVSTLDLARVAVNEVKEALRGVDGVFLAGGNSYLLLWHARRSGFAGVVSPLVESGELLYVGTSAGAMVAGPDLAPAANLDNRREVPELESSVALGFVPFTVLPHDNDPEAQALHDDIVAAHPSIPFVRLKDGAAVLVRDDAVEVVDSPLLA
ncbi:MAG TPA: Type 1 glutamine amidotransferase-like domain-containing protein [Gaiellaceae bacterium]|nr:Type 1 glutamine amidotransferase-like domain-containing protein [Gaiellaceae bacterium]